MGLSEWEVRVTPVQHGELKINHGNTAVIMAVDTCVGTKRAHMGVSYNYKYEDNSLDGSFSQLIRHELAHILLHELGVDNVVKDNVRGREFVEQLCDRIGLIAGREFGK